MCHDCEWRGCGSADVDVQWSSDSLNPIKLKVVGVICPNNSLVTVRVVKPNLLFCIHQRNSEGVGRSKGEGRRLSGAKGIVRRVVRRYGEEEVSHKSIQE